MIQDRIERELLALVLNNNQVLDLLQIKPKFFKNNDLKKILEYVIESYKKFSFINIDYIAKEHSDFDMILYADILTNEFYHKRAWREQLKYSENYILDSFKEEFLRDYNEKLRLKNVDYEEYVKKIKEVDDYKIIDTTETLTRKELIENIKQTNARIVLNNFPKLSDTLKLAKGDFTIIGATTGTGKSSLLLNLMNDLMTNYQCIYFNMEMSKSTIYKRMISINSNVPIGYLDNPTEYQKELIDKSIQELENNKVIIEHKATDIDQIRAILIKLKNKDKHTILFIDHLGLTKSSDKKNLYEQMTDVAKKLRQICLELDCTIISASQLNRSSYSSDTINLSMLKDSGELENSASKVLLLTKGEEFKKDDIEVNMIIDIAKNRDGILGSIKMKYDKSKQIFKEE